MGIMFLSKTMGANPLHRPIFLFSDTGEFLNDGDKPWRISVTIEAMVSEVLLQQPHPLVCYPREPFVQANRRAGDVIARVLPLPLI